MGLLGAIAVVLSEAPLPSASLVAAAALVHAAMLARRELRRPVRRLVVPHSAAPARVDDADMEALEVQWRGPLAVLAWRDPRGRRHRLHAWPDTLRRPARRELRLALAARGPTRVPPSVAP